MRRTKILVGLALVVVLGTFGIVLSMTLVGAAGQVLPAVTLNLGDSTTLSCKGSKLDISSTSATGATVKCLGAPTIQSVTGVSDGATLRGKVNIEVKATAGSSPIASVLFELSKGTTKADSFTDAAAPYFFYGDTNGTPAGWDTSKVTDGSYSLAITVLSQDKLTATRQINFSVNNAASPAPTPTKTASPAPTSTSTPNPSGGTAPNGDSMSMGLWNPNTKYDVCVNADGSVNADATSRIKQLHDSFNVIGPDGKRYPTWHPPTAKDPATGATCNFGHEHGKDPSTFPNWSEIKAFYAYNGDVAHSGIPFGYVNEQMDAWSMATGSSMGMRHEDHVGHKVEWGSNVAVNVMDPTTRTTKATGLTCNYLAKVHQGTTTHDAFQNNLHEVLYFAMCNDGQNLKLNRLMEFGQAGQFLRLCDPEGDRTTVINTGFTYSNPAYPGTAQDGVRNITDRSCVANNFLVPPNSGKWSMNMYEAWPGSLSITGKQGQPLVRSVDLLFDVENSMRYYYPGKTHPELADGSKYSDAGFTMDLCYEVLPNGNRYQGGACDIATKSGTVKGITWDDPRSAFKGTNRAVYFKPGTVQNTGGPTIWYTDPFGGNGQTTPFAGSVKQYIISQNVDYDKKFGGFIDPTKVGGNYESPLVHAPN